MKCSLCNELITEATLPPIKFTTERPRIKSHTLIGSINATTAAFSDAIQAARGEVNETYWFHRPCWDKFKELLSTD